MLPKIEHPQYSFELPSSKKKLKIRPMLSREEKLLLMAKESTEANDILQAINQVCFNCILNNDGLDINSFATFDIDMLFLKLRAISITNVINVTYTDADDSENYDFEIDLESIKVKFPEKKPNMNVTVNKDISLKLQYPRAKLYQDAQFNSVKSNLEMNDILIRYAIESVITTGKNVAAFKDSTDDEQQAFLDDIPLNVKEEILKFVADLPTIYHCIEYKNKKGDDRKIELTNLNDFFTLR